MALSDYERYQLEWMIEHGHSLTELVEDMSELSYDMPNTDIGALFDAWEADCGFGGEVYASESEWREAEGKEQNRDRLSKKSVKRSETAQDRAHFIDRLVILDTRPGRDGQTDALLYDPGAPKDLAPFIIAQGYDEEYKSWQAGSYRRDLLGAVCEFRGAINPKWAISGCTPDDVVELYGDYCRFGPGDAEDVAHTVNEWISNYDDLFTDEIGVCVEERLSEGKLAKFENTPEAFAACVELHGAKLVSPEDIMGLVASYEEGKGGDNLGVFAAVDPSGLFTVCDNETGECFVESFETVAAAYSYMTGADPLEAREMDRTAAVTLREHAATPDPVSVARDALDAARAAKAPATPTRNASVHQ